MFPLYFCHYEPHRNFLNKQQSLTRGRGICKEEGKEETKLVEKELLSVSPGPLLINSKLKEEL